MTTLHRPTDDRSMRRIAQGLANRFHLRRGDRVVLAPERWVEDAKQLARLTLASLPSRRSDPLFPDVVARAIKRFHLALPGVKIRVTRNVTSGDCGRATFSLYDYATDQVVVRGDEHSFPVKVDRLVKFIKAHGVKSRTRR